MDKATQELIMRDNPCFPAVEAAYSGKGKAQAPSRYNADIAEEIEQERAALVASGQWDRIEDSITATLDTGEPFTIREARTIAQAQKLAPHWAWEILDYAERRTMTHT